MMKHVKKGVVVLAALAMAGMIGVSSARADLVVTIQEDAGTVVQIGVVPNTGPATFTGTIGPGGSGGGDFLFAITIGTSNSPGLPSGALLQLSSISITSLTGSSHTLNINVSAQGFTTPNGLTTLVDTASGSLVNGAVSGTFQAFADSSNTLFGTATPGSLINFSASGVSQSIAGNGAAVPFSPLGATYSLTIKSTYTLAGGSSLTLTGGNAQVLATPEPASMASAIVGVGLIGGLGLVRRRNRQS